MLPILTRIMSNFFLLSLFLLFIASVLGGLLPLMLRFTHRGMQLALSFVSGIMIGVTVFHLLPDAVLMAGERGHELDSVLGSVGLWTILGFLSIFILERFICFHHHTVQDEDSCSDHSHASSWLGALIGLSIHGLLAGLAYGAAITGDDAGAGVAGAGLLIAIVLHKPFDSLALGTLLAADGKSRRMRNLMNLGYALITPIGAVVGWAGISGAEPAVASAAIGFAAGMFLCIAFCDLLPELQFHHHDRLGLTAALVIGLAASWGSTRLVGHAHSHGPPGAGAVQHDHDHDHDDHDDHDEDHHDDHEDEDHDHDHARSPLRLVPLHSPSLRGIAWEFEMDQTT